MTRMLPSLVNPDVQSGAERRLFDVLRDAPGTENWICLHSLALARHESKRRGEIDFLLLSDKGVFVLEVKGGRVFRRDGVWTHVDRFGRENSRSESPFDQASTAMFSLERHIREHFGQDDRMGKLLFGFGVMFPDIIFDESGVEADPRLIYDARDRTLPLARYVDRLSEYARERTKSLRYSPSPTDIHALVTHLRGDFDLVPPLGVRIDEAATALVRLSSEQYAVLDAFDTVPGLIVQGGAGTGKTLLAVECGVREWRNRKGRVLFLCYNRVLSALLQSKANERLPRDTLEVRSVYSLMNDLILKSSLAAEFETMRQKPHDESFWTTTFPEYAAIACLEGVVEPYDTLIIDEAQDMMCHAVLDVLDRCIKGGFAAGRWRVFCDANNQGALYGRFEPDALDRLCRLGRTTLLATNRRNTRQIADETTMLAAPRMPSVGVVSGVPVEYSWYDRPSEQGRRLKRYLERLTKQRIPAGRITVLSPRGAHQCAACAVPGLIAVTEYNVAEVFAGTARETTFSSVSSFKGLENDFIVITDIDNLDTEWWKSVIYVGMSRARAGLCLMLDSSLKADYESCLRHWMEKHDKSTHDLSTG